MSYTILEFKTLDSTNTFLKTYQEALNHLTFVRTRHQTQGRGQFDRTWVSNPNENILCSVLLKDIHVQKVNAYKAWIEQGLMQFLTERGLKVVFKAPNDLYVGERKICGILTETQSETNQLTYVVIGFGLNVNQTQFEGLNATSMAIEANQTWDVDALFEALIHHLLSTYGDI
ncbi:biotin--[acetyl-CoA-carboxylase] ligase [Acholeplasma vituli]|uniref:Biotin--[acetyl-CoA-carboxylase] ligase n=1 Tax=Paracholeplasma vituli TaxID=69473 RepID=A0ABT2PVF6_9MOLU|nr:biotin--[acetyl-CoA-carboxylase] ligase [Paracholeplasma vituli]MCU0104703.1 biotin--[acetyl-CoA-carboxylase] ligase [Paracholeplasma vituli]